MATLALAAAGAAVGSALLPAGISLLGATLSGAAIGIQIGALAGSYVDQALFGASGQSRAVEGPRLQRSARHGLDGRRADPAHLWPRAPRRPGDLGDRLRRGDRHHDGIARRRQGHAARPARVDAVDGLSLLRQLRGGAVRRARSRGIGRVWADGRELDLRHVAYRLYTGTETQAPDSLIVAHARARQRARLSRRRLHRVRAAAARRLRQSHSATLVRSLSRASRRSARRSRGVVLIPGSGEFVYATEPVTRVRRGRSRSRENVHTLPGRRPTGRSAIDQLEATLPNAQVGLAGRQLVRHRSARGQLPDRSPASRRPSKTTAPSPGPSPASTRANALCRQPARRPARLRRHAVRRRRRSPRSAISRRAASTSR